MKKALSLFLAIMMIFGALSSSASAVDPIPLDDPYHFEGGPATNEQVVLKFYLDGGTLLSSAYVYHIDGDYRGQFKLTEGKDIKDVYVMVPLDSSTMKPGYYVTLPQVVAPTGFQFVGWYCYDDTKSYAATYSGYQIPENPKSPIIEFRAAYAPQAPEEDTIVKVLDILVKIFGSIIGLIMFPKHDNPALAGQAYMRDILSGIMG